MEAIDYKAASFWWMVIQSVALCGLWVYNVLANRTRATREEFERLAENIRNAENASKNAVDRLERNIDQRLDGLEQQHAADRARVSVIEGHLNHQPTQDDMRRLERAISEVSVKVAEIGGQMEPLAHLTKALNQFMMEGGHHK